MFDAESAIHPANGARHHTLFATLKHVFWRAPHPRELLVCVWLPLGCWLDNGFSVSVLALFATILLMIRSLSIPIRYCENRWADRERGLNYGACGATGLVIFYLSLPIFFKLWTDGARNGIDWNATGSNALSAIAFGVFLLILLGPLMWLLDRVFKPFAKRSGQTALSAFGFISLCGAWWLAVIFGSIHCGFGHVMFGSSPR